MRHDVVIPRSHAGEAEQPRLPVLAGPECMEKASGRPEDGRASHALYRRPSSVNRAIRRRAPHSRSKDGVPVRSFDGLARKYNKRER